ncbi:MAG TPA: metalloregulator ArsR/SmtB family transcription factor [Longimicrobiaceae bacterium]|nr:metalloregulator ArsR/SmtB family transcription factor [Longimicrobiaceae bacterium]
MSSNVHTIFDRMSALSDTTRSRLLLVLEQHELTVSELCAVLQLPQSTVSRHLKVLGDEEWVVSQAEGTSRRYRMLADSLEPPARRLWNLVREQVAAAPVAEQDAQRVQSVLARRRTRSQEFFSSTAGEWDRLRAELFGRRMDLLALLALVDPDWAVGDLGCGTGQMSESLAPFVRRVIAVDESVAMLAAARKRLEGAGNVEVRRGTVESLPIDDGELDAAILFLILPYLMEPGRAIREAARALRPGGRLLVVDMMPHDREEYRQRMGHLWQGFSREEMEAWFGEAGFWAFRYHPLPADPDARGPVLFAASGRRSGSAKPSF